MLTNGFGGTFHLHNTLDDKVGYNELVYHYHKIINAQKLPAGDCA